MTMHNTIEKFEVEGNLYKIYVGAVLVMVLPGEYVEGSRYITGPADIAYDEIALMIEDKGYSMRLVNLMTGETVYATAGKALPEDETAAEIVLDIARRLII